MVVEQHAQLCAERPAGAGVQHGNGAQCRSKGRPAVEYGLQRLPVGSRQRCRLVRRGLAQSGFRHQPVARVGSQRLQRERLHIECRQETDFLQQQQFEGAQCGCLGGTLRSAVVARQHLDHARIHIEQGRVRIVPGQQAQQQFVEVITRHQRLAGRHHMATHPLGALERADFGIAAVSQLQRLQRQQHGTKIGTRPLGAFRHQRDAAVVAREHFQDQARLAPVVAMQHIGRFVQDAVDCHFNCANKRPGEVPANAAEPALPGRRHCPLQGGWR